MASYLCGGTWRSEVIVLSAVGGLFSLSLCRIASCDESSLSERGVSFEMLSLDRVSEGELGSDGPHLIRVQHVGTISYGWFAIAVRGTVGCLCISTTLE